MRVFNRQAVVFCSHFTFPLTGYGRDSLYQTTAKRSVITRRGLYEEMRLICLDGTKTGIFGVNYGDETRANRAERPGVLTQATRRL